MIKFKRKLARKKFYRINQYIQAQEVRVVNETGKQVGVMPIQKALQQAHEKGLDLVEVAPKANPPVCKIIDFKKFRYLESKKTQQEKRKSKKSGLKEIRLRPFIAKADFDFRIKRGEKFLKEGNKIKLVVVFRGRELRKKTFGYEVLKKTIERLAPYSKTESEPKFVGRRLEFILTPLRKNKDDKKEEVKNQKINRQAI